MAVVVLKEVNRHPGLKRADESVDIIAGQPLVKVTNDTVKAYDGSGVPFGLAAESTSQLPVGDSESHVGKGFDYSGYARGGFVGAFMDGGMLALTDDGRGAPYEEDDSYVLNEKVYANSDGLITADAGNATEGYNPEVGIVQEVVGSPVTKLVIKLLV